MNADYRSSRVYEDGVHHVRRAALDDRHPLPWMIGAAKQAEAKCRRRAATEEEAIAIAKHLTQIAIKRSPHDRALFDEATENAAIQHSECADRERKAAAGRLAPGEPFSTVHFNCIRANPAAQVWQCVSLPGERGAPGRRVNGRAPKETPLRHDRGECAIMVGREPLRDTAGQPRVFRTWQEAEGIARDLYDEADERGEVIGWTDDAKVVERLTEVEIIFDPLVNGDYRPFSLWFPRYNKPHYAPPRAAGYVTGARGADGNKFKVESLDQEGQRAHDFNRKLDRLAKAEEAAKKLTMELACYRTIWEAEAEALRLEREYFNNAHLYP